MVLGLPLIGAQVAQILVNTTDTVMLGWLSTEALAAGTLAHQLFFVLFIVGIGFAAAMVPVIAAALGEEEAANEAAGTQGDHEETTRDIRRATRMGLWVLILFSAFAMVPLWFAGPLLSRLGQPEEVVTLAVRYLAIAQWSFPPALLLIGLRQFLTALERAQVVLWITIATLLINAVLNYALIFGNFGFPRLEIEGAAWATVGSNTLALLITMAWVHFRPDLAVYDIFRNFHRPEWPTFQRIAMLGWPIGLALLAEAGLFAVSTFMMGTLGTVPLAAHGIAIQLASISFMIPLGLSQAATVRVGNAAGRHDRTAVGHAGRAAFLCGLGIAVTAGLIFLAFPPAADRAVPGKQRRRGAGDRRRRAARDRGRALSDRRLGAGARRCRAARVAGHACADADRHRELLGPGRAGRLADRLEARLRRTRRVVRVGDRAHRRIDCALPPLPQPRAARPLANGSDRA